MDTFISTGSFEGLAFFVQAACPPEEETVVAAAFLVGRTLPLSLIVREAGHDVHVPVRIVEYQLLWWGK